jgi:hypothetical protein
MGGTCGTHGGEERCLQGFWLGGLKVRDHSEDLVLSQPNPVRHIEPYLPKFHLNVILLLRLGLPSGLLPSGLPVNTSPLPNACHMSRPPHRPDLITVTIFGEEYRL